MSISSKTSKEQNHLKLAEIELGSQKFRSFIAGQVQIAASTPSNKTKVMGNLSVVQQ
jgi:hypothetical protein